MEISEMTYSQAMAEMEKLLGEMESGQIDVDQLTAKSERITALLEHCKSRLRLAQDGISKVLDSKGEQNA